MYKTVTRFFMLFFALSIIVPAQAIFNTGQIGITLNNYGRVRVGAPGDVDRQIDRSSLLVVKSQTETFDYKQDAENEVPESVISPSTWGDHQINVKINNTYSNLPPAVTANIDVFGWNSKNFAIARFAVISNETASFSAILGMEVIPQLGGAYGLEILRYDNVTKTVYTHRDTHYVGYKILNANYNSVSLIDWYTGYEVDTSYFNWLTLTRVDTFLQTGGDGGVALFSQHKKSLNTGDTAYMYVGISYGTTKQTMDLGITEAQAKYNERFPTSIKDVVFNPSDFELLQNYPNPFNPSTVIAYNQPREAFVELKVYDLLGNEIATLFRGVNNAGVHSYNFDASKLSNGTYFYTLRSDGVNITRKMTILK